MMSRVNNIQPTHTHARAHSVMWCAPLVASRQLTHTLARMCSLRQTRINICLARASVRFTDEHARALSVARAIHNGKPHLYFAYGHVRSAVFVCVCVCLSKSLTPVLIVLSPGADNQIITVGWHSLTLSVGGWELDISFTNTTSAHQHNILYRQPPPPSVIGGCTGLLNYFNTGTNNPSIRL